MQIITELTAMRTWSRQARLSGKTIALVPTMGYFHEGHLSLMRSAARRADLVVVSLFVNPIQFGAGEDLERYPRDMQRDSQLAAQAGVDILFSPEAGEMYPPNFSTTVTVAGVSQGLCGRSRPGHFNGVATVLSKLFNLILPHQGVFGEKDFQQLAVIRALVRDLEWDIEIIGHPIVREEDGLAMSSRNVYLDSEERRRALAIPRSLEHARRQVEQGQRRVDLLHREVVHLLEEAGLVPEYVEFVDEMSLTPLKMVESGTIMALAARCGTTRLIDNCRL